MNLNYIHPKRIGIVGNKNNRPANIRFAAKTLDINFSENIKSQWCAEGRANGATAPGIQGRSIQRGKL